MSLEQAVKNIVGRVCESAVLRPCVRKSALRSINVVYYHYVGEAAPHYQTFYTGCTVSKFERDLRQLSRVFDFAPLGEVVGMPSATPNGDRPLMAVTFDDGLRLSEEVFDALDRYHVSATTFVITSCVGNR